MDVRTDRELGVASELLVNDDLVGPRLVLMPPSTRRIWLTIPMASGSMPTYPCTETR